MILNLRVGDYVKFTSQANFNIYYGSITQKNKFKVIKIDKSLEMISLDKSSIYNSPDFICDQHFFTILSKSKSGFAKFLNEKNL